MSKKVYPVAKSVKEDNTSNATPIVQAEVLPPNFSESLSGGGMNNNFGIPSAPLAVVLANHHQNRNRVSPTDAVVSDVYALGTNSNTPYYIRQLLDNPQSQREIRDYYNTAIRESRTQNGDPDYDEVNRVTNRYAMVLAREMEDERANQSECCFMS